MQIGVRPNDDLAKSAQIKTGERTGGFVIDEKCVPLNMDLEKTKLT